MQTANPIDVIVGGRVRLRRIQLGIEAASLAATLGIPAARLRTFEAGRERINAPLLCEIARTLNVQYVFFFENPAVVPSNDPPTESVLTYDI